MNIFEEFNEPIRDMLVQSIGNPTFELEFIYGAKFYEKNITKETFMRILDECNRLYSKISDNYTLDIQLEYLDKTHNKSKLSNLRTRIKGLDSIKKYCKTNSLDGLSYDRVKKRNINSIQSEEYNYRVNLKEEEVKTETSPEIVRIMENWPNEKKHFRFKKTTGFLTKDRLFRFDLSGIKSTKYNKRTRQYETTKTFVESNILNQDETFEV